MHASPFSAVVLAGGRSTRMGRDKARLTLADGRTLLARQLGLIRAAGAAEIFVSARPEQELELGDATLVIDRNPDCGPLGGIAAALAATSHPHLLVLAIDLARMPAAYLATLVVGRSPTCGVIPLRQGRPEPLAAIYPREAAPLATQALAAGERRATEWARQLVGLGLARWREVPAAEGAFFANWNRPEEIAE